MEWRVLRTLSTLELTPTITERAIIATSSTIHPWVFLIKASQGKSQILIGFHQEDQEVIIPAFSIFKQVALDPPDFIFTPITVEQIASAYVFVQKKHYAFPLFNMYRDMYEEMDPLGAVVNSVSEMSKVHGDTFVWIGIKGMNDREELKAKSNIYKVILKMKRTSAKTHVLVNTPAETNANLNLNYSRGFMNVESDIERKRVQSLFNVTIMFASQMEVPKPHVTSIFNTLKSHNQLIPVPINKELTAALFKNGILKNSAFKRRSNILSLSEVATIVHPPSITASVSSVQHTGFKNLEVPFDLPSGENVVGYAVGGNNKIPVSLTKEVLERNVVAVGNSGFGKSTIAIKFFLEGIKLDPQGTFIFYDPHGDATNILLKNIPEDRIEDTILLDAADTEYPFSYNLMDTTDISLTGAYKRQKDQAFYFDPERFDVLTPVIKQLVDVLRIISVAQLGNSSDAYAFGPRAADIFSHLFGFFMSTIYIGKNNELFGYPVFTMADAIKFLIDDNARLEILNRTIFPETPPDVSHHSREMKEYWNYTFPKVILGYARQKSDTLSAATNKIRNAIPPRMLKVSCQIKPKFKMSRFMKPGKIIIIRVPESIGSHEAQTLLSSSLFSDVHFELVNRKEDERIPTYLFFDEADTISWELINTFINKDRKFGAHLLINFQNLKQVNDETRDSIFSNVNSIFAFRTSGMDGRYMEDEFNKAFLMASDFTNTAKHYAYARIPINGRVTAPFVFETQVVPEGSDEVAQKIRDRSRNLIARPEKRALISFIDIFIRDYLAKHNSEEVQKSIDKIMKDKPKKDKEVDTQQGKAAQEKKDIKFIDINREFKK